MRILSSAQKINKALKETIPGSNIKWNAALRSRIIAHIQDGASINSARVLVGIPRHTFSGWVDRGSKELEAYCRYEGTEYEEEKLSEHSQFIMDMEIAKTSFALRFKMQVHSLYLEDVRYGTILMRLMEAEFPEYYGKSTNVNQKTELKVRYTFRTVDGDDFNKPRISEGQLEEEEDSGDIIEAAYKSREENDTS